MYTCPMHPEVVSDKPGMCPKCGMKLVELKNAPQPDKHGVHTPQNMFTRFLISLIFTVPVVVINFGIIPTPVPAFIMLALSLVVFWVGGLLFIKSALREIAGKSPGMMTLIAVAVVVAFGYSVYSTFAGGDLLYWELTTLISVMLLGHYMEMKAVGRAQGALAELAKLIPDTAERVTKEGTEIVPAASLAMSDIIMVRPGSRIPADGVVVDGESYVDESLLTGESKPVEKSKNSGIIAGALNGDGALKIMITKTGDDSFVGGIKLLVADAQASKSRLQILSDRAAFYLTLIALAAAFATLIYWFANAGPAFAFERAVAVLVIACPHALGLAIPLVASISTSLASRNGFLVKNRLALEEARNIDTALFDKTGTLTKGEYEVSKIWPAGGETDIIRLAASVDLQSEHFVAKAIVAHAQKHKIEPYPAAGFEAVKGRGAKASINNVVYFVGGSGILDMLKADVPEDLKLWAGHENTLGNTVVYVFQDSKAVGGISLADSVRAEAKETVAELSRMGVKVIMITGDSQKVAQKVADELSIKEFYAGVLPAGKAKKVTELTLEGKRVAFVGDGINDAPALAAADLGVAFGAGTNVAIESAGIILVKNDPLDVVKVLKLSKKTYGKMLQNLFWATGYNVIAIPLAAGILASRGISLEPAVGALFMSASTVIVAVNALLLRRVKLA